jgi:aryl-alcohol dehydrogenase-like predicted oxidoreductase
MDHIVNQGKALYWGTSEWNPQQIEQAYGIARREHLVPPQMEQPQYNMFVRARVESELVPLYRRIGLGTTIWSPLASGLLSGKYNQGVPKGTRLDMPGYGWLREQLGTDAGHQRIEKVKQLVPLADELGCTTAQLALAWCLKNPNVSSVITGASRAQQFIENCRALEVVPTLTDDVMARIEQILKNKPAPIPDYAAS